MKRPTFPTGALLSLLLLTMLVSSSILAQKKSVDVIPARVQSISPFSIAISGKLALCSHNEKGSIILDVSGGRPPYSFKWNTNENTQNRSNLFSGTYTVEIRDADDAIHIERIVIQPPYPLILDSLIKQDASCGSGNDGYAKIGVKTGRGEPYKVKWSHGLEDSWEAKNLVPGTYTVTVSDRFNCTTSMSFEIESVTEGIQVEETIQEISCEGRDGAISLNVIGGAAPYSYIWSNGATESSIGSLTAGDYSVLIQDQKGCSIQAYFTLSQATPLEVSGTLKDASCSGNSDGAISLSVRGGSAPYTYLWGNNESTSDLNGLVSGEYQVRITDAMGCSVEQVFQIENSSSLNLSIAEFSDVSCSDGNDGQIRIDARGAYGELSILWSDGVEGVLTREDLAPGTYSLSVSDESSCVVSTSFTINKPEFLTAKIESMLDIDCDSQFISGVAWVSVQGGKAPYEISWNDGEHLGNEINFSKSSLLKVTIKDALGCVAFSESRVDFPSQNTARGRLDFNYRKLEITSESEVLVQEEILFESEISEEFMAWNWDFGDGKVSVEKDPIHLFDKAGTYEVTLTGFDIYGCSSVGKNTISVTTPKERLVIPNAFTPNGDGLNDFFTPKFHAISTFSMEVFNTWGERMYSTTSLEDKGWDGTYQGQLLPAGNYLYKITYTAPDNHVNHRSGGVTLIR